MPTWKLRARSYHFYPGWVPYQHAWRKQAFSCFSSFSSKEEGISSPVLAKKNYQEKLPWQTDNRYWFPNILVSADTPWNVLTLKTALSLFKIHCFYSFSFGLSFWAFHCKQHNKIRHQPSNLQMSITTLPKPVFPICFYKVLGELGGWQMFW